jgi:hypothetical protein
MHNLQFIIAFTRRTYNIENYIQSLRKTYSTSLDDPKKEAIVDGYKSFNQQVSWSCSSFAPVFASATIISAVVVGGSGGFEILVL